MIGAQCFGSSGLEELILPANVKEVCAKAFYWCTRLKNVQLNEGLQKIGEYVFACTAIKNITLPSTLKRIETETF